MKGWPVRRPTAMATVFVGLLAVSCLQDAGSDFPDSTAGLPTALPMDTLALRDGDTVWLKPIPVARRFRFGLQRLLGFNGRFPGPVLLLDEGARITVAYSHSLPLRHGLIFLGLPYEPTSPNPNRSGEAWTDRGDTVFYRVRAETPGVFEYRAAPHEDYLRGSGLVGALRVRAADSAYWARPSVREEILIFDEIGSDSGPQRFARRRVDGAFAGTYGSVLLINGREDFRLSGEPYREIRFFALNASNARSVVLDVGGVLARYIGGDIGRLRYPELIRQAVLGPGERAVFDFLPADTGDYALGRSGPGEVWEPAASAYGNVRIDGTVPDSAVADSLDRLFALAPDRPIPELPRGYPQLAPQLRRPVDRFVSILPRTGNGSPLRETGLAKTAHATPGELGLVWEDTGQALQEAKRAFTSWEWRDVTADSGGLHAGAWKYRVGDTVKIRLENDSLAHYSMAHTLRVPGQKILILRQWATGLNRSGGTGGDSLDWLRTEIQEINYAWKSAYIVATGRQAEFLLVLQSPGTFRFGCGVAEHDAGGEWLELRVEPALAVAE